MEASAVEATGPQSLAHPSNETLMGENCNAGQLKDSYVLKDSPACSGRVMLGKVLSYDSCTKLFTVLYENGHREVLDHQRVSSILMGDGTKFARRKRKLDQLATVGEVKRPNTRSRKNESTDNPAPVAESPSPCLLEHASEDAADSSSDSCDYEDQNLVLTCPPPVQVVPLPPSSGDINVPEESIPLLFSVYNFLRSFSLQLFLSPFGHDDFVGSLNCTVRNNLLDAIHLSLMRAVRRHLQMLASEDSDRASKCLKHCEWNLLDALTWPVILVGHLYMMGYMKQLEEGWSSFGVSGGEYYGLPVALKLKVMQILCDDVVDSAEFRTELEMREGTDEVDEYSENSRDPPESGPRRVHPRCSKTSACENMEALERSIEPKTTSLKSYGLLPDADASDVAEDGNSDECRLCGMDGMLICCDGCPSAYHSRCIGLTKLQLPDGPWFCPECTINKQGMSSSKIGRGTNGAEIFGTDANGRMFLGTCNYLLVVGMPYNSEPLSRYYNQDDVANVLSAIIAVEDASPYADICRGISKYWEVPLITMQGKSGSICDPFLDRDHSKCYPPSHIASAYITNVNNDANGVNCVTNIAEEGADSRDTMRQKNCCIEEVHSSVMESAEKADFADSAVTNHDLCTNSTCEASNGNCKFAPETASLTVKKTPLMSGPTNTSEKLSNGSVVTVISCPVQPTSTDRLILSDTATCGSVSENVVHKEVTGRFNFSSTKELVGTFKGSRPQCYTSDGRCQRNLKLPALFEPHAYTNQYIQGDIAASAAANLAVFSSEESNISGANISLNPRKRVAANTGLQMKAFSAATPNFFWPGVDKKLMEPRERCGWCLACKTASTCKKGCLLNLVATSAIKRSARNFSALRSVKHFDSHLPVIAAQIAHMEEKLQGLISGPLSDREYNKQWKELIRGASSFKVLKFLLLDLEKNIRGIAFSGDWSKLLDNWLVQFSSAVGNACPNVNIKKRGRRSKKQSVAFESERDSSGDISKNVQWWRGGKLSNILFQKASLPSSLVKKASRQGGIRRISGIHYPEGPELPRRSRQFAWRASVEMSKNAAHLALQVRYLDSHIRWKDLVRPEQTPLDGKGSDGDLMAFRNAMICDKRITENKIKYALTFEGQHHLPLRVTKNILETEKFEGGSEKLWFFESYVPLYLINEYEENISLKPMASPAMSNPLRLPIMRRRRLKIRSDVFSYLMRKKEEPIRSSCPSCQTDVFLRDASKCSTCQGYCHKDCALPSIAMNEDDLEFTFTCNSCYAKSAASISNNKNTSSMQPSLEGQNMQHSGQVQIQHPPGLQRMPQKGYYNSTQPIGKIESPSIKSSASGSNSAHKANRGHSSAYGLIWKRKKGDDSGKDFRIENIILKGMDGIHPKADVSCSLCKKPYRSDLMFIKCQKCTKWFHADALELEESQIFELVGFKCFHCRKKGSPKCPYAGLATLRSDERTKGAQSEASKFRSTAQLVPMPKTEEFNDPLLSSLTEEKAPSIQVPLAGPISARKSQQKLSVRRPQVKHENVADEFYATQHTNVESLTNPIMDGDLVEWGSDAKEPLTIEEPNLDAKEPLHNDVFVAQQEGPVEIGNPEDMEFEPQTYFSFTELLASDDDQLDNQCDMWPSIDLESSQSVLPCDSAACETGSSNQVSAPKEPVLDLVPCHLCKLSEPSPDLVCEVCKMIIHSHCSPWEDSEDTHWVCGNCREWR